MSKRSVVLFALLFAFWLIISESLDSYHLVIGLFLSLVTILFWHNLGKSLPAASHLTDILGVMQMLVLMIGYIVQANITVAKTLVKQGRNIDPVVLEMNTNIESNWVRVLLATCITITPGTIAIDVNPDTGCIVVHALTEEIGMDLLYWRLIDRMRNLGHTKKAEEN